MTDDDELLETLKQVEDPLLEDDVVSLGLVDDAYVEEGVAQLTLDFGAPYSPTERRMGEDIRDVVEELGLDVELYVTPPDRSGESIVPEVENLIAVASGKGGVGKSTVSVNLAAALADEGAKVGLLDGDVYGPTVPRMVGVEAEPGITEEDTLVPPEAYGMKLMSMAFLVGRVDDPAMLRGPMIDKILVQLLDEVEWGELDYLVVDLPPGTGDAQMTLMQNAHVDGAVVVTTPEDVAVDDVRKGVKMFDGYGTPVLGVVENMTEFRCPDCGGRHRLYGEGGGVEVAEEYGLPVLSELPMLPAIRRGNDEGAPPALADEEANEVFGTLAREVADAVGIVNRCRAADVDLEEARGFRYGERETDGVGIDDVEGPSEEESGGGVSGGLDVSE